MKTSTVQFEMMVTFMEQHGDISKPSMNTRDRMRSMQKWDELSIILNSDGGGDTKSTEKWKKVWSDFKNNTKKKAARIRRAVTSPDGRKVYAKLGELEQRVLNIIGVQAATGLAVEDAELSQSINVKYNNIETDDGNSATRTPPQTTVSPITVAPIITSHDTHTSLPSDTRAASLSPLSCIKEEIHDSEASNQAGPSTGPDDDDDSTTKTPPQARASLYMVVPRESISFSSTALSSQAHMNQPESAPFGQTRPRHTRLRPRRSPRGRVRPSHTEQATGHFLQAEENWRTFKMQQHRDFMYMRREQNRIRELEIQMQRDNHALSVQAQKGWQALGSRALDILDKLVDKHCKE